MPDALFRRGPLDGYAGTKIGGFSLALAPPAARFVLRGDGEVATEAGAAFGVAIPRRPLSAESKDSRAALWLGPDEWLLLAEGEAPEPIRATLEAALAALPVSLVDVSERQIGLTVGGPLAARALNAGCPLDLAPEAFGVDAATRTRLGKAEITLWRREPGLFHVEVGRSFADYTVRFLEEAARRAPCAPGG